MQLNYPSNTYFLSNPEDYLFFSAFKEKEVDLTVFEDVISILTEQKSI